MKRPNWEDLWMDALEMLIVLLLAATAVATVYGAMTISPLDRTPTEDRCGR